ncbi:MAG TPA: glycosyltransferase family 1 protein [Anaerolineae bacterium]|nr:glycosyltransferase family 1 protein [Anaerolineae bacterium]HQH38554.1 glycosyltransferase family 1 protein [Anaerolineae bacterium]
MRLVINATEIGRRRGGNESYLTGLLQGLAALNVAGDAVLLATPDGLMALPTITSATYPTVNTGPYRPLPFYLWQQTYHLAHLHPDWYLSTFFLPPITPCHAAVLVHDMSFRAHPEYFPRFIAFYMRMLTGLAVRRAERVIALSEFTRREIVRFHPAVAQKTSVVLPGVSVAFRPAPTADDVAMLAPYGLTPGYILALGNIHPRKNLARLLEAYTLLRERCTETPPLVWAGVPRWSSADLTARARAAGVLLPGFIAQTAMPALYRQAALLVYPSLYEGFGLPPLEALACGTPVVTSNTTSLPEAVGEAALTVDPTDVSALAEAMALLLTNVDWRAALRSAGLDWSQRFTWTVTARNLLAVLYPDERLSDTLSSRTPRESPAMPYREDFSRVKNL